MWLFIADLAMSGAFDDEIDPVLLVSPGFCDSDDSLDFDLKAWLLRHVELFSVTLLKLL